MLSPATGQAAGLQRHLDRHFYSVLYELMRLIKENPKPQATALFRNTVSTLSKPNRKIWDGICELANGGPKAPGILRTLVSVRDNTGAHYYGLDGLAKGYDQFFSQKQSEAEAAYLSRGTNVAASRYYFVDAAVQGYQSIVTQATSYEEIEKLSRKVSLALFLIVTRFIENRAGGFYRVKNGAGGA